MQPSRPLGMASIALGLGALASAILGPLALDVIKFHVSENAESQLIGGEIVTLGLVGPLAILAGVLWLRGHRLAPLLSLAPGAYAIYTYVQFIIGPDYTRYEGNNERAFPLFLALVILGWIVALRSWARLGETALPEPTAGLRRALGGIFIFLSVVFALTWAASLVDVLDGGPLAQDYLRDPTLFWLVRLMDLGFVIPAGALTGVGLLRGARWATRLAYGVAGFLMLEVGAVAGMAVNLALTDDPSSDPVLLVVTVVMTIALAAAWSRLLRRAGAASVLPGQQSRRLARPGMSA